MTVATALGQSSATTYIPDNNGSLTPGVSVASADGVTTDIRRSINGREVPLEQVQEKVLSQDGNTTVTERITRHYGNDGVLVSTDRVVTETTKTGDGDSIVKSRTYRPDVSGNMVEAERKTVETHKEGSTVTTQTEIVKPDLSGSYSVAEKRTAVSQPTSDGRQETETVMRRDMNGNLSEAQRISTTETKSGGQTIVNKAIYEPGVNGGLALTRQTVDKTVTNPDGTSTTETEIFGRPSNGHAYEASAPPTLTEKRTYERQKGPGGAIVESQTVQLPSINDPTRLDPPRRVSETICRGECEKKQ